jgi:energy-coupling factor transport system permease protein
MQLGRLCAMLAGLALLLATTGREQLIGGFYLLLRPLRHVGLEPQRFAARLWLTLHYVEQRPPQTMRGSLFERLTASQAPMEQPAPQHVDFSLPPLGWRDLAMLAAMAAGVSFL